MKAKSTVLLISILIVVVSLLTAYLFRNTFFSQKSASLSLSTMNTIESPQPTAQYSVNVISTSKVGSGAHDVSYKIKIENLSIKPYISNFSFYECNFIDNNGNEYKGTFMTETSLDKAITPGESQTLSITSQANLNGYDRNDDGFQKCVYQTDGNKTCSKVSNLKTKNCNAYITSDGKQASNGWGKNPITVEFPSSQ